MSWCDTKSSKRQNMSKDKIDQLCEEKDNLIRDNEVLYERLSSLEDERKRISGILKEKEEESRLLQDELDRWKDKYKNKEDEFNRTKVELDELNLAYVALKRDILYSNEKEILDLLSRIYTSITGVSSIDNGLKDKIVQQLKVMDCEFVDFTVESRHYYEVIEYEGTEIQLEKKAIVRSSTGNFLLAGKVFVPQL